MQWSGRIAPRLKIATPGEYFVIDTGWLMDDPQFSPGSTRKEVIEAENDPSLYHLEDRSNNRSHKFEED